MVDSDTSEILYASCVDAIRFSQHRVGLIFESKILRRLLDTLQIIPCGRHKTITRLLFFKERSGE